MKKLKQVVFTNLDGVLVKTKSGEENPIHSGDWIFYLQTIKGLKHFTERGFKIVIVTNQEGIKYGLIDEVLFLKRIEEICENLEKLLNLQKNSVSYYYYKGTNLNDKKPNPRMAHDAVEDWGLTLKGSVMFGKDNNDYEFSRNSGIRFYYGLDKIKEKFNAQRL